MRTHTTEHAGTVYSGGINSSDREQILLDDLRHEVKRLADAVERQNELLETRRPTAADPEVDR